MATPTPTPRSLIWAGLAALMFPLVGCDSGNGPEPGPTSVAQGDGLDPSDPAESGQKPGDGQSPARSVTPNREINPDSVVDVVEAEVEGGEAEKGPSPEGVLWDFPDESAIADEPLTVEVPIGLPELAANNVVPAANPLTTGKYELGRMLYFDPRVSKDGQVSCATCHDPEKGWTDQLPTSVGIKGQVGARNAPTVLNTAYGRTMFWDGRAPSLEGQAQGPIQNKIEMGDQSYEEIIDRLRKVDGYRDRFRKTFGTDVTLDGMAKAIATFERVAALSGNSKYDQYRAGDMEALNESQKRGLVLFGERLDDFDEFKPTVELQKAKCTLCHVGFNFSDEKFHNLGVGWVADQGKFVDPGRWAISAVGAKDLKELGAFKTPMLRDLERTVPYMHDGSEPTLESVVDYYDKGGLANPYLDVDMKPLKLTESEKSDLVAFLKSLSGEPKLVDLPELPPGPDGTAPDPKAALETPSATAVSANSLHGVIAR